MLLVWGAQDNKNEKRPTEEKSWDHEKTDVQMQGNRLQPSKGTSSLPSERLLITSLRINYKEDTLRTCRFISKLTNKDITPKRVPILYQNRKFYSCRDIANVLANSYCQLQKKGRLRKKNIKSLKRNTYKPSTLQAHGLADTENIFDVPFSGEELISLFTIQKVKKSTGQDKIQAEFLKHIGPNVKSALLQIFNRILTQECWLLFGEELRLFLSWKNICKSSRPKMISRTNYQLI